MTPRTVSSRIATVALVAGTLVASTAAAEPFQWRALDLHLKAGEQALILATRIHHPLEITLDRGRLSLLDTVANCAPVIDAPILADATVAPSRTRTKAIPLRDTRRFRIDDLANDDTFFAVARVHSVWADTMGDEKLRYGAATGAQADFFDAFGLTNVAFTSGVFDPSIDCLIPGVASADPFGLDAISDDTAGGTGTVTTGGGTSGALGPVRVRADRPVLNRAVTGALLGAGTPGGGGATSNATSLQAALNPTVTTGLSGQSDAAGTGTSTIIAPLPTPGLAGLVAPGTGTGAGTATGTGAADHLGDTPAPVPLPASFALLLSVLGGLSVLKWRRRNAA